MTAATTSGYTASASSDIGLRQAHQAFDNILYVSWHEPYYLTNPYPNADGAYTGGSGTVYDTNGYEGEYLQIQLPEKIKLYSYSISSRSGTGLAGRQPKDAKIFASNDGSTWIDIHTHNDVGETYNTNGETRTFQLDNITETYYIYYRLVVNSIIEGGTSDTPNTSQWQLYGIPEYDPEAHGTDVIMRSVPNVPNTDWLEVYYDGQDYTSMPSTVTDKSGNGVTGTPNGGVGFDTEYKAFTFDGSGDYIKGAIPSSLSGNHPYTFSLWIKPDAIQSSFKAVFEMGNRANNQSCGLYLNGGSIVHLAFANNLTTSTSVVPNQWIHITGTYTSGSRKVYADGVLLATDAYSSMNIGSTEMTLGANNDDSQEFDGSIANFRLFNRALTKDEIWQLYAYQKEYFDVSPDVVTFKGGRLGIGTSDPRATLEVRGDIYGGCPVYFHARRTSSTTANTSGVLITWDTVETSRGGGYDPSNGKFTAPIKGVYKFIYYARGDGTNNAFVLRPRYNDVDPGTGNTAGTTLGNEDGAHASAYLIHEMNEGDTLEILLYSLSGTMYISSFYNGFYGYYLSSL
jgi:hypothetical protein